MRDKVLIIDDDMGSIKAMGRMLAGIADIQFACTGADALRLVRASAPSLILLDAEMPDMSGFEVCTALKSSRLLADIPVIFVTRHSDVAFEVKGFEMGAVDFIAKPVSPPLLLARVKTQLRIKRLGDDLRRLSTIDSLTQVANRRAFDDTLAREWKRAKRGTEPMSLLLIDVDHFKRFNDHHGHPAGDQCLQQLAKAMEAACMRPGDMVARYGGEEFVLLMPMTPRAGAAHVAARVLNAIASLRLRHDDSPTDEHVSVSIGIACFDSESDDWPQSPAQWAALSAAPLTAPSRFVDGMAPVLKASHLIQAADRALYSAKSAGRAQAWMLDLCDRDMPALAFKVCSLARRKQAETMA